uniref:Putative ribonuclease H-like domain-containing protein n=1 Tax=Tanacetum cinerariifolium TaxID=118510 RepID=A0A699GJ43_TANCI|nr:putative ribonuclease H-like domain-containing protein [Tanacetum cinerariifolium]
MSTQKASSFVQTSKHVKTPRPSVKPVEHPIPDDNLRKYIPKFRGHGNSRNRKACFVCKKLCKDDPSQSPKDVVPTTVLTRSRLVPFNADRPVNTVVPQTKGYPHHALKDKGVIDSGCSRHMTGNMSYLFEFEEINGGYVAFGGNPKGGKITGKGKIRTGKLDFDDVYFVKELKFNLFSVSQMCDMKNSVLFTDTECIVLSSDFKLPDENRVLLRVPRENNMYNVDLKNIVFSGYLTCFFAKATLDESNLWHRRLGHINFKTMNKLVKGNLVRGLPSKVFKNNHTCVACKKGKQHRASCKTKAVSSVSQPLQRTLIEAARTMLADSLLPIPFWAETTDDDTTFEVKEPKSKVHVFSRSSVKTTKHDDKTKREAKGKSRVNTPVPAVGQNSTNSTNTFSVAGPSNTVVSPTLGKSSYVDPSQYPDDLDMPTLEDITYSDDEEDVGAEADFSNLETNIIEEGIDYEEVFALVAWIEARRLFLAYASYMGFMVYQMDVKNAFLYGTIKEEVYVCQPPGFKDPYYLDKNGFHRGKIDQNLFIKKQKGDILLVQVYVDDIIFGSTNKDLCKAFEKLMKQKFQMSSMGELTFFLGLQVKKKQDGIFISQDKYVAKILRKFGLTDGKSASTPIDTEKPLLKDSDGEDV